MRRLLLIPMLALLAAGTPATAGTPAISCSPGTTGWPSLVESGAPIPSFMFGSELVLSHVAICDDGVFFYFRTRSQGSVRDFCMGFVRPTQEAVTEFMGADLTDPMGKSISILEATAIAAENYENFRGQIQEVLGRRYALGKTVTLNKDRWKATLKIEFGTPFIFSYRTREASIQTGVFNVFTKPDKDGLHPVLIMMLLMTRQAP